MKGEESAASESSRLEVYPPIHRLGAAGRWVRARLQTEILRGTPVLVRIQGLRTPGVNAVMQASSFLGEEEFYMLLVALVVWIVDAKLGRLMVQLMGICFYVTGFLKNTLCLPRPPSPPVTPLQRCQDWSLPSHHAVLNTNVPWFLWFYLEHYYPLSLPAKTVVFAGIAVWSSSVMFSRIYLGVHSPADILTGGVVGCILLAGWLQCYEKVDDYLSSSPSLFSLLGLVCIVVLLLSLHPDPHPVTIVFAETVCMSSVAVGFVVGQVLFAPPIGGRGLLEEAGQYSTISTAVGCSILRYIGGLVVLVVFKILAEKGAKIVFTAAAQVAGVTTVCIKRKSEVTSERVHYSPSQFVVLSESKSGMEQRHNATWVWDQRPLNIDIPVKFTSYTIMGVVAMAICPALFTFVNI